jgi:phospholipid/cholesterol/gamma-HCH transport system substrate-binding protein
VINKKNLLVGIFVVAGLLLFATGVFLIGDRHQLFSKHVDFYTDFANLSGLTKGSTIRVNGMDAGKVASIQVPTSPSSQFRIRLRVDERMHGLIRSDSLVTIETAGVVGETYLAIHSGSVNAPEALPMSTLPSKPSVEMAALLDKGEGLLDDADGMLKQVGGKLNGTLDRVTTTLGNANDLLLGVKEGRGPAGLLLRDSEAKAQIRDILLNAQQATANVNHATGQVNSLLADIQSRQFPQRIDQTMNSVKDATDNVDHTTVQIRRSLESALGPDSRGIDAAQNINEAVSNLNIATGNMSDDTEALKRNFFFRGFFKKRGFYNLTSSTPDEYRRDPLFSSPKDFRVWLTGSDLFVLSHDGAEILSPKGKELLDAGIARYGEVLPAVPVVVEGYSNSQDKAQQMALSYGRAVLVRHYLENRFHLESKDVGVIALQDLPPPRLDHEHWDGVCIVVLKKL